MSVPLLRPLSAAPRSVRPLLPVLPAGVPAFVVVHEGGFAGLDLGAGDVLVCRGEAVHGELTVLVPRGHGRPRLGRVRGTVLEGDAGEPCSSLRWAPAGRVVARYRLGPDGWVVELLDGPGGVQRPARAVSAEGSPSVQEGRQEAAAGPSQGSRSQLSLFAAA